VKGWLRRADGSGTLIATTDRGAFQGLAQGVFDDRPGPKVGRLLSGCGGARDLLMARGLPQPNEHSPA
jgi:hypothetical protein